MAGYEHEFMGLDDSVLKKHSNLLTMLANERVICIDKSKGDYFIMECCDEYFYHKLTKEDCIELSELFREIAERI